MSKKGKAHHFRRKQTVRGKGMLGEEERSFGSKHNNYLIFSSKNDKWKSTSHPTLFLQENIL